MVQTETSGGKLFTRAIEAFDQFIPLSQEEKAAPNFKRMGVISYDAGKQAYVIWSVGSAMSVIHLNEDKLKGIKIDAASERILVMGNSDVRVGRLTLSGRQFEAEPIVTKAGYDYKAELYFSNLLDPNLKNENVTKFEGERLLKALIGEDDTHDGGIAKFTGDGEVSDFALIVNVPNASQTHTLVGFFKPEHDDLQNMDSMLGLFEFSQGLNLEFVKLNNRVINDFFELIDQTIKKAEKLKQPTDSSIRIELYKARFAACVLLAEICEDKKSRQIYQQMFKAEQSDMAVGKVDLLGMATRLRMKKISELDLGKMFVDDFQPTKVQVTAQPHTVIKDSLGYEEIQRKLTSVKIREFSDTYHARLNDAFYNENNGFITEILDNYWKDVLAFLRDENDLMSEEELLDMVYILEDLKKTRYCRSKDNRAKLYYNSPEESYLTESKYFTNDPSAYASRFVFVDTIPYLIKIAQKRAGIKAAKKLASKYRN